MSSGSATSKPAARSSSWKLRTTDTEIPEIIWRRLKYICWSAMLALKGGNSDIQETLCSRTSDTVYLAPWTTTAKNSNHKCSQSQTLDSETQQLFHLNFVGLQWGGLTRTRICDWRTTPPPHTLLHKSQDYPSTDAAICCCFCRSLHPTCVHYSLTYCDAVSLCFFHTWQVANQCKKEIYI